MKRDGETCEAIGAAVEGAAIFRACYAPGGSIVIELGSGSQVATHGTFEAAHAQARKLTRRARGRAALAAMRKLGAAP